MENIDMIIYYQKIENGKEVCRKCEKCNQKMIKIDDKKIKCLRCGQIINIKNLSSMLLSF